MAAPRAKKAPSTAYGAARLEQRAREDAERQAAEAERRRQEAALAAAWEEQQRAATSAGSAAAAEAAAIRQRQAAEKAARQKVMRDQQAQQVQPAAAAGAPAAARKDPTPHLLAAASTGELSKFLLNWGEFLIKPDDVKVIFQRWLQTLWFAPENVMQKVLMGASNPIYVPYYIFECRTVTSYSGDVCTVTETILPTGEKQQKDLWTPVKGIYKGHYKDILVCGAPRTEEWAWALAFKDWDLSKVYFEPDPLQQAQTAAKAASEGTFAARLFKTLTESIPVRVPPRPLPSQLQPVEAWHVIWHEYDSFVYCVLAHYYAYQLRAEVRPR
jgi:hypothetical protein